jgi:hypothetical protein
MREHVSSPGYPLRLDGTLDPPLNRWLWLVKWLLILPHAIVLTFLWIAFAVLSVVAFFAILITGSYPRALFEFNVGVLRWSWRVAFYSYSALGTDRYPPFTLDDVPDYPARLEVQYPQSLSRGLVLVKSWLLALPHYLIIGVFGSLVSVLTFVAGIMLLFTGRYPEPIFDLALGADRWIHRVIAYAALMTDDYPPFRLDVGGEDAGPGAVAPTPAAGLS